MECPICKNKLGFGGINMNNLEKHQKELEKYLLNYESFCVTKDGDICSCRAHDWNPCGKCLFYGLPGGCAKARRDWLMEKCVEPKVDWLKVPVDTPILVRSSENNLWKRRYFARYEHGMVYAWNNGMNSWTADGSNEGITGWPFAKLAE